MFHKCRFKISMRIHASKKKIKILNNDVCVHMYIRILAIQRERIELLGVSLASGWRRESISLPQ